MNRSPEKHLDESEIETLVTARQRGEPVSLSVPSDAEAHVRQCKECAGMVQSLLKAEDILSSLKRYTSASGSPCNKNIDWYSVAAGVMPGQQALQILEHAASCARCGGLLKQALEDLGSDITPEEEALLEGLDSSSLAWQTGLARKLYEGSAVPVALSHPKRWFQLAGFRFAVATVAVLLLCLGIWQFRKPPSAQFANKTSPTALNLISQAYTERRTIEPRFPDAAFGPLVAQRGPNSSTFDRPVALLKAEAMISEGLLQNPHDLSLKAAQARADLLEGKYDPAINELTAALSSQPDARSLLLDLGIAYLARADQLGSEEPDRALDYGKAIEYLSRYLAVLGHQDDTVALFNRAIAEERAFQYGAALKDWSAFLGKERDKNWRDDGQRRYDDLQKLLKNRGDSNIAPELDPAAAAALLRARLTRPKASNWHEPLDEAYLNLALDQWIGELSRAPNEKASERYRSALVALSEVLAKLHHDDWLADLLSGPANGDWNSGMTDLSEAARSNETGDDKKAIDRANLAVAEFQRTGNRAGLAAAEFELLHALDQSQDGDECLRTGEQAKSDLTGMRYPWLEAEISFDRAACWGINQNPQRATTDSQHGKDAARGANYGALALCGAYFLDGVATQDVATTEAWNRVHDGLREFWASPFPPRYGAFFYTDLGFLAEKEQLLYLAEIIGEESVAIHESAPDLLPRAASHSWLAQIVEARGDHLRSEAEFQKANEILMTPGYDTRAAQATLEIERASLEVARNDFRLAKSHLKEGAKNLAWVRDASRLMQYHEAKGIVDLRTGDHAAAEEELLNAISLIEKAKHSLSSESDLLAWQHDTSQAYRALLELYSLYSTDGIRSLAFLEWYRGAPLRFDARHLSSLRSHLLGQSPFPVRQASDYQRELLAMTSGTPILAWASFPSMTVIWEFDRRGLHWARVPVSSEIVSQTAIELTHLCSDPNSDTIALSQHAGQLYDWLVAPVSAYLPASGSLIVEPDDILTLLPFQVLKRTDGRFLGEIYTLSESPGLIYSAVRRPIKPLLPSATQVLAVGDPLIAQFNGEILPRLPDADREVRDIAAHFPRSDVLSGGRATLNEVLRLLPRAHVFHFAGHAVSRVAVSGLLLAPESANPVRSVLLDASVLHTQSLQRLQLTVLSGCETAVADRGMMDPASLVRAFLSAGVPELVASKWRVDSRASADIMDLFYNRLLQGDTVPVALAHAEQSMRSIPATSHPYYWSGFSAFGAQTPPTAGAGD